jgi:uncharacterized protein (DUF362 family)
MTDEITRRDFLRRAVVGGAAAIGIGELVAVRADMADAASSPTIAVASKRRPAELVRASVEALGGIGKFVKKGNRVVIKPNIGWARKAEQAATTNPEIVAEIVRLCKQAGARDIRVVDHAVDRPDALVLRMSGIEAAARKAGAQVSLASSPALYEKVSLPKGRALKSVSVIRDLRRADVFINVPIAKVHNTTGLTLGIKNMLGAVWDRGAFHRSSSLDQAIVDCAAEVRPHLVILDAIRILLTNGPKGPGRTADKGIVVAGTDQVAVDAYAATLFDRKAEQIGHLQRAHAAGLGEIDLRRVNVRHV